jgi:hypothetical protein
MLSPSARWSCCASPGARVISHSYIPCIQCSGRGAADDCRRHASRRRAPERCPLARPLARTEQLFDREEVLGRDASSVFPTESKAAHGLDPEAVREMLGTNTRFISETQARAWITLASAAPPRVPPPLPPVLPLPPA